MNKKVLIFGGIAVILVGGYFLYKKYGKKKKISPSGAPSMTPYSVPMSSHTSLNKDQQKVKNQASNITTGSVNASIQKIQAGKKSSGMEALSVPFPLT